jgi:hypothetical protein
MDYNIIGGSSDDFYIQVTSAPTLTRPRNNNHRFQNDLEKSIILDRGYEVALTNISYPIQGIQYKQDNQDQVDAHSITISGLGISFFNGKRHQMVTELPPITETTSKCILVLQSGLYHDIQDVLDELTAQITSCTWSIPERVGVDSFEDPIPLSIKDDFTIRYSRSSQKFSFIYTSSFKSIYITFGSEVKTIFGISPNTSAIVLGPENQGKFTAPFPHTIEPILSNFMCINLDIVKHQLLFSSAERRLATLPLHLPGHKSSDGTLRSMIIEHLEYKKIDTTSFHSLDFHVMNEIGQKLSYSSRENMYENYFFMTLHFRPVDQITMIS